MFFTGIMHNTGGMWIGRFCYKTGEKFKKIFIYTCNL